MQVQPPYWLLVEEPTEQVAMAILAAEVKLGVEPCERWVTPMERPHEEG